MPSGIFYLTSLDYPIKGVSGYFLLVMCFIEIPVFNANNVDPDQMPQNAVSDLSLHFAKVPFNGLTITTPWTDSTDDKLVFIENGQIALDDQAYLLVNIWQIFQNGFCWKFCLEGDALIWSGTIKIVGKTDFWYALASQRSVKTWIYSAANCVHDC